MVSVEPWSVDTREPVSLSGPALSRVAGDQAVGAGHGAERPEQRLHGAASAEHADRSPSMGHRISAKRDLG